jgi:hypothetical protein
MKPGTLTNFFQKTGTYVHMTPTQQNIAEKKLKSKKPTAKKKV